MKELLTRLQCGGLFCAICLGVEAQENYGGREDGVARFKAQLVTLATE
jgi:hypothetical protein